MVFNMVCLWLGYLTTTILKTIAKSMYINTFQEIKKNNYRKLLYNLYPYYILTEITHHMDSIKTLTI